MLNTTIQLRIDSKTKRAAQRRFQMLGIDLSSALKLLLRQALTDKHFSFAPLVMQGLKLKRWKEYKKDIAWARKYGKRYATAREMHADILKEDSPRNSKLCPLCVRYSLKGR